MLQGFISTLILEQADNTSIFALRQNCLLVRILREKGIFLTIFGSIENWRQVSQIFIGTTRINALVFHGEYKGIRIRHVEFQMRSFTIKLRFQVSIPSLDHFEFAEIQDASSQVNRFIEQDFNPDTSHQSCVCR